MKKICKNCRNYKGFKLENIKIKKDIHCLFIHKCSALLQKTIYCNSVTGYSSFEYQTKMLAEQNKNFDCEFYKEKYFARLNNFIDEILNKEIKF